MGIIVAIDGPAGSGKSSTAKEVALQLKYLYIDTGAMYRAVTLETINRNVDVADHKSVIGIASEIKINFQWIGNDLHTFMNGNDVSKQIRSSQVAELVSPVAAIPGVREILAGEQRLMAEKENIVMEGRDIGTNVFPEAEYKIYMQADVEVRAKRRLKDYINIGQDIEIAEIVKELQKRDKIDSSRSHSPLKKADDAIVIDTTNMDFNEQVKAIVDIVDK